MAAAPATFGSYAGAAAPATTTIAAAPATYGAVGAGFGAGATAGGASATYGSHGGFGAGATAGVASATHGAHGGFGAGAGAGGASATYGAHGGFGAGATSGIGAGAAMLGGTTQMTMPATISMGSGAGTFTEYAPQTTTTREVGAPVYVSGQASEVMGSAVVNTVHQEQVVAGSVSQNVVEIPSVQTVERVEEIVQKVQVPVEQVVEQIVEQFV